MKRGSFYVLAIMLSLATSISAQVHYHHLTLEQTSMPEAHGLVRQMIVVGNYWFIAEDGVSIYDISNPTQPQKVATVVPMQQVVSVDYADPYLYIVISDYPEADRFCIFDITDVHNPVLMSQEDIGSIAGHLKYINGYLYVSSPYWQDNFYRIYNVMDPSNPFMVYEDSPTFLHLNVEGNIAVMFRAMSYSGHVKLYDVSNPEFPVLLSTIPIEVEPSLTIRINGSSLYIIQEDVFFNVYDISDPSIPVLTESINLTDSRYIDLQYNSNLLVMTQLDNSLQSATMTIYDNSDPFHPTQLSQTQVEAIEYFLFPSLSEDTIISSVYIQSRRHENLFLQYDINDPYNVNLFDGFGHYMRQYHLLKSGSIVYSAGYQGVWLVDWSDPDNPEDVFIFNGGIITDIELVGSYLYAGCEDYSGDGNSTGLYIFDVSDPQNPYQANFFPKTSIKEIETNGTIAYIAANSIVGVYDLGDPVNPVIVGSIPQWDEWDRLTLDGDVMYLVGQRDHDNLKSYSVENPQNPVLLDTYSTNYPEREYACVEFEVSLSDGYLVVTGDDEYLKVFDVSDPTDLSYVAGTNDIYATGGIIENGILYISQTEGLTVLDFSSPTDPQYLGSVRDAYYFNRVLVDGNSIVAAVYSRQYLFDSSDIFSYSPAPSTLTFDLTGALVTLTWEEPVYDPPLILEGYNVYRDGELIATTDQTTQIDLLNASGSYEYTVTAVYSNGESDPAGPVIVSFTQTLRLTLDPYEPYLQVPPVGGPVYFHATLENLTGSAQTLDAWTLATTPAGNNIPLRQYTLQLGPYETFTRNWLLLDVPPQAPAGTYTFKAFAGNHPDLILATDQFQFTKAAAVGQRVAQAASTLPDASSSEGWMLSGWATPNPAPHDGPLAGSEIVDVPSLPTEFAVAAYPNPFNERATITLSLPESGEVKAQIYDITGRRVAVLLNGSVAAGTHELAWDADGLASGVYFLRVQTADHETAIRKLALVR